MVEKQTTHCDVMKLFILVIVSFLTIQVSTALDWNLSVRKSGSMLYACSNDTVIFPYLYNLSESESIVFMSWSYHGNDVTKSIGTLIIDEFMTTNSYFNKVILKKNGNFTMLNVNNQDTGKYILKIQTQDKDQSKKTYTKEFSLVVSKTLMYKGNNLKAKLSHKAEWNSDTKSFSLSLTCGDFIFKNDNAPIGVEWITPDGSVKNYSSDYKDGKFYLQLDNPLKYGQYACKISNHYMSTVCATSKDNTKVTVNINEDKVWIILLKNEVEKLKEQDKKINKQNEELNRQNEKLNKQNEKLNEQNEKLEEEVEKNKVLIDKLMIKPSCEDLSYFESGKRTINPNHSTSIEIYCDQDTDDGRWNVFQKRYDGSVDFYRGWSDYRNGFGDPDKEFWLGLETVHQMTKDGRKYELRFDMESEDGSKYYAVYDDFSIGSESEGYAVHFTGYKGNAGDSFSYHKDMMFTTKDHDNDPKDSENCAVTFTGAWWYKSCHKTNLNGLYNYDGFYGNSLNWQTPRSSSTVMKKTEMKFRLKK